MIQINKFNNKMNIQAYDSNDVCIGVIENGIEWMDFRLQILSNRVSGYYVLLDNGTRLDIAEDGSFDPDIFKSVYDRLEYKWSEFKSMLNLTSLYSSAKRNLDKSFDDFKYQTEY